MSNDYLCRGIASRWSAGFRFRATLAWWAFRDLWAVGWCQVNALLRCSRRYHIRMVHSINQSQVIQIFHVWDPSHICDALCVKIIFRWGMVSISWFTGCRLVPFSKNGLLLYWDSIGEKMTWMMDQSQVVWFFMLATFSQVCASMTEFGYLERNLRADQMKWAFSVN